MTELYHCTDQDMTNIFERGSKNGEVRRLYHEIKMRANQSNQKDVNLRFYRYEIKSGLFTGHYIEEMLKWRGDYDKLETPNCVHWLFPIPNPARGEYPLQENEAKAIRVDDVTRGRCLEAYRMKLDFFGMSLYSEGNGKIVRHYNYKERYRHLNRNTNNFRCITRILTCLGELGYERYQVPWVIFLIDEVVIHKLLPTVQDKNITFWIAAIKNTEDQSRMKKAYQYLKTNRSSSTVESISQIFYEDSVSFQWGDCTRSSSRTGAQKSVNDSPKMTKHSSAISKPSHEASDRRVIGQIPIQTAKPRRRRDPSEKCRPEEMET